MSMVTKLLHLHNEPQGTKCDHDHEGQRHKESAVK